ncbi:MAG: vWA domain-containing protein [Pirellulaceae bacterium]
MNSDRLAQTRWRQHQPPVTAPSQSSTFVAGSLDDTIKLESLPGSRTASMVRPIVAELPRVNIASVRDRNLILEKASRAVPSWLVSFCLHVLVIVTLALFTFGQQLRESISLSALATQSPVISEDIKVDFSSLSSGSPLADVTDEVQIEAAQADLELDTKPSTLDGLGQVMAGKDDRMDGSEFVGIGGDGAAQQMLDLEADATKAAQTRANFFGLSARGNSFVFVLDCSGSMGGERWYLTVQELLRSLRSLDKDTMFLVLLYSGDTWAMFNTKPADTFLIPASKENVDKLEAWLSRQFPNGPTFPMRAMSVALQANPDAVFLLSDGEFQDNTVEFLQSQNVVRDLGKGEIRKIPIHTIAMDFTLGMLALRQIASENDGQFRMVNSQ